MERVLPNVPMRMGAASISRATIAMVIIAATGAKKKAKRADAANKAVS
jgi:hypothetical protein